MPYGNNRVFKNALKYSNVTLKYLSSFWISLEMLLINCKIHLELRWTKDCVMSSDVGVTNTKLDLPISNQSSNDNVKRVKRLEEGFKRI